VQAGQWLRLELGRGLGCHAADYRQSGALTLAPDRTQLLKNPQETACLTASFRCLKGYFVLARGCMAPPRGRSCIAPVLNDFGAKMSESARDMHCVSGAIRHKAKA
jgi:hypothetical protein